MDGIELGPLLIALLGGLALFLFGMEHLTEALKRLAGAGITKVLARLTKNRFKAALTGAFITAVIQSSSVTTVLVVGFVSAGLLSLPQSIGVIMGANIGTTITAQIIAFKVTKYALAIVAVGFAGTFLTKQPVIRRYGAMLVGLGLIFLGMGFMSEATAPLRTYEPFIDAMRQMGRPALGILVGAAFTALVQSSSATTGLVIVLAAQGFISLEAGIFLSLGANIGTCVTAGLAAFGKPRAAGRAALVHLLFNVFGALIWLGFVPQLAELVQAISPKHAELEGTARLAAEAPRQIANAHTIFNVVNTCLFIWFTTPLAKLVVLLLPDRTKSVPEAARPRFLDTACLDTPALALDRVRLETLRLGEQISDIGIDAARVVVDGDALDIERIVARTRAGQQLFDAITDYNRALLSQALTDEQTRGLTTLSAIGIYIQSVGQTNAVNLMHIARTRLRERVHFGPQTLSQIARLGHKVEEAFALSVRALDDPDLAKQVIDMKSEIQVLVTATFEHLGKRLASSDPDRILLYRLETLAVEIIQREYYFAKKIAKAVVAEHAVERTEAVDEHEVD